MVVHVNANSSSILHDVSRFPSKLHTFLNNRFHTLSDGGGVSVELKGIVPLVGSCREVEFQPFDNGIYPERVYDGCGFNGIPEEL